MIPITFKDYKNINYGFNHFFGKGHRQEAILTGILIIWRLPGYGPSSIFPLKGLNMSVTRKRRDLALLPDWQSWKNWQGEGRLFLLFKIKFKKI